MNKIAIFASGSGTNAQCIAEYFHQHKEIVVSHIFSNNPQAYVLKRAEKMNIPAVVFTRKQLYQTGEVLMKLKEAGITHIVLAGFLWLIPLSLIQAYPRRIFNIHPALLPAYGGKGMYGMKVHEAVVKNREKETGITIHYVNAEYDRGDIIFQAVCPVDEKDTPEEVAQKVHSLEYKYYPRILEQVILGREITGN